MVPQGGNSKHFFFNNICFIFLLFFYRFQYKNNIRIVSWNMKFICIRHETGEKLGRTSHFPPFLSLIQINFIFQDTIRILSKYLSLGKVLWSLFFNNICFIFLLFFQFFIDFSIKAIYETGKCSVQSCISPCFLASYK